MATPHCPVCQKPVDLSNANVLPFCSLRCKTIDLGRWLNEDYGLPTEPDSELPPDNYSDA